MNLAVRPVDRRTEQRQSLPKTSTLGEVYTLMLRWRSQMIIIHDLVKEDVSIDTCAARCNVYIVVPEPDSR